MSEDKGNWVRINVGGKTFFTSIQTLTKDKNSMLSRMFAREIEALEDKERSISPSPRPNLNSSSPAPNLSTCQVINSTQSSPTLISHKDSKGAILIDRDPTYFKVVLNYLRYGKIIVDNNINLDGVLEEAMFFQIQGMIEELQPWKRPDLTRSQLIANRKNVRFEGVRLMGVDLSYLDFSRERFVHSDLQGTNFQHCNLNTTTFAFVHAPSVVFRSAEMIEVDVHDSVLCNAEFSDACVKYANFHNNQLSGSEWKNSVCFGALFQKNNLSNCIFKQCNLTNAKFQKSDLKNSKFIDCVLTGCHFTASDMRGVQIDWTAVEEHINYIKVTKEQYDQIPFQQKEEMQIQVLSEDAKPAETNLAAGVSYDVNSQEPRTQPSFLFSSTENNRPIQ